MEAQIVRRCECERLLSDPELRNKWEKKEMINLIQQNYCLLNEGALYTLERYFILTQQMIVMFDCSFVIVYHSSISTQQFLVKLGTYDWVEILSITYLCSPKKLFLQCTVTSTTILGRLGQMYMAK